jgi:hypothetical protein
MTAPLSSNVEHFDGILVGHLPRGRTREALRAAFAINGCDATIDPRALDRLASTTMDGRSLDIQGVPEGPSRYGAA